MNHTLLLKYWFGKVTIPVIYIEDMIIIGNDAEETSMLQDRLSVKFEMKNLGSLKYFLGIKVARSKLGIFLPQQKYVRDLLVEKELLDCKSTDTPINPKLQSGKIS